MSRVIVLLGLALLLGSVAPCAVQAQTPPSYQLGLSHEDPTQPHRMAPAGLTKSPLDRSPVLPKPGLGEFGISLDSQVLSSSGEPFIAERFFPNPRRSPAPTTELVLRRSNPESLTLTHDAPAHSAGEGKHAPRDFGSTLTLNAGFLHPQISRFANPRDEGMGAARRIGRWAVYGEFQREDVLPISVTAARPASLAAIPLANRVAGPTTSGDFPQSPRSAMTLDLPESMSPLALNNYYLEAIYNFLPAFQGKVSYKRSIVETADRNEKLQVEGIVEAGKDVVIKAGYRNESAPELQPVDKPAKDTKVWTEFILKF